MPVVGVSVLVAMRNVKSSFSGCFFIEEHFATGKVLVPAKFRGAFPCFMSNWIILLGSPLYRISLPKNFFLIQNRTYETHY